MHIERVGNLAILDLISVPIPTSHKYSIINFVAALARHKHRHRLDFDLLRNPHARLVQDQHILILRADHQQPLVLVILNTFVHAYHARNVVFVVESSTLAHVL